MLIFLILLLIKPVPAARTRAVLPFPSQTALRWAALGPKAAPVTIVNQQPMIALPMLMVTEPSGSPMSWSSSTIGACVRNGSQILALNHFSRPERHAVGFVPFDGGSNLPFMKPQEAL